MKKNDPLFKKYHSRLAKEGLISSICHGLLIGACADFLTALGCWLFGKNVILPSVIVGLGVTLISAIAFWMFRFRPTEKKVLRRVDSMGLEERAITMKELENEDSYVANLQRADARKKVSEVTKEQQKAAFPVFAVKAGVMICMIVAIAAGAGMTAVVGLTSEGVIPSPGLFGPDSESTEQYVNITYLVEGGGDIDGAPEQSVLIGEDGETVIAVADDGWNFVGWSDGGKSPERNERKVIEDITLTALFEEVPDPEEGEEGDNSNGEEGEEGDADDQKPDDDSKEDGEGGNGEGGEGNGDGNEGNGSGTGEGGNQDSPGKGDGKGEGAGGGWSDGNQVIDGETDYRDIYDIYYDMAMEILNSGGELPPDLREFIEKYYGSI